MHGRSRRPSLPAIPGQSTRTGGVRGQSESEEGFCWMCGGEGKGIGKGERVGNAGRCL